MDISYSGTREELAAHLHERAAEADRLSKAASGNEKHRQAGIKAGLEQAAFVVERWTPPTTAPEPAANGAERHAPAFQ